MFTADWLMRQEFPPIRYVIPGVIPEGFTLLAAPPKVGKSWLVLDLAYQLATGGHGLGKIPLHGRRPVLYLALEDGPRRLKDRLTALDVTEGPELLSFGVQVASGDVIDTLRTWMQAHKDAAPVAILDTLGKVAPPAQSGESDYQRDYRIGGALKAIVDEVEGAALIVVHHTRKNIAEDFLDAVSGTQGLAGSADSVLVLRRPRTESVGSLSVTSRDAAEGEYAVEMIDNRWHLTGADLREAATAHAQARATANLGEDSTRLIEFVNEHPEGVRAKDVSEHLALDLDKAGRYLRRAAEAGRIEKADRGLYTPVRSVRLSDWEEDETGHSDTTDTRFGGGERCRVCAEPLLAPGSIAEGICGKRDEAHATARGEAA